MSAAPETRARARVRVRVCARALFAFVRSGVCFRRVVHAVSLRPPHLKGGGGVGGNQIKVPNGAADGATQRRC